MNDDLQTAKDDLLEMLDLLSLKLTGTSDFAGELFASIDDYIDEKIKASNIQAE